MVSIHGIRAKDRERIWVWPSLRGGLTGSGGATHGQFYRGTAIKLTVRRSHRLSWLRARVVVAFVLVAAVLGSFNRLFSCFAKLMMQGQGRKFNSAPGTPLPALHFEARRTQDRTNPCLVMRKNTVWIGSACAWA